MRQFHTLEEIIEAGYVLVVERLSDIPMADKDRLLYVDPNTGRLLIARAPILADQVPSVSS